MDTPQRLRFIGSTIFITLCLFIWAIVSQTASVRSQEPDTLRAPAAGENALYLPVIVKSLPPTPTPTLTPTPTSTPTTTPVPPSGTECEITGADYELIPTDDEPDPRPDEQHADLKLSLRGYEPWGEYLGLVEYTGDTDSGAPQLDGLLDGRSPAFNSVSRVYDWNWECNCRGELLDNWPVTLAGLATTSGEILSLPDREGGDIYQGRFKALVIYASNEENSITLKYTRNDDVVQGYTLHVEDVCVDPRLVELYRQGNGDGRHDLPALDAGQAFGKALGDTVGIAIRDQGTFMDPRSRKDWWRDHSLNTPTPTGTPVPQSNATATPTSISSATPTSISNASVTPTPTATSIPTSTSIPPTVTPISSACDIPSTDYELIPTDDEPDPRKDEVHADLNLGRRGYEPWDEFLGLVEYGGSQDPAAPQLHGLFANPHLPTFNAAYRVYDWNWDCDCRGDLIDTWPVTLIGMNTTPGATIHLPDRQGGDIYQGRFKGLVIYASDNSITIKYTRNDDVINGYTLHVENICVEPRLLALYQQGNQDGRHNLPALAAGQAFGRTLDGNIGVAIRDQGSFMDPRSRFDWWHGYMGLVEKGPSE